MDSKYIQKLKLNIDKKFNGNKQTLKSLQN